MRPAHPAHPGAARQPRPRAQRPGANEGRRSGGPERDAQRRAILAALSQNNCGPQYRQAGPPRGGLFEALFGAGAVFCGPRTRRLNRPAPTEPSACEPATVSISRSRSRRRQRGSGRTSRLPAAMPGGRDGAVLVSKSGRRHQHRPHRFSGEPYTALPNAFRYRRRSIPPGCRQAGRPVLGRGAAALAESGAQRHPGQPMGRRLSRPRLTPRASRSSESRPSLPAQGRPSVGRRLGGARPEPRGPRRRTGLSTRCVIRPVPPDCALCAQAHAGRQGGMHKMEQLITRRRWRSLRG